MTHALQFPAGFTWGVATSSHQIEGDRAGRCEDSWDRFSSIDGVIRGGDRADVACDHLRLMDDDVRLMADMGIGAYRFSISWARVASHGGWRATEAGLGEYRRLVDLLVRHDIQPVATLYHWDHPQQLEDAGGWRNRDCASWFAEYASDVGGALGDGVARWATLNEPWCVAFLGHASGEHAPGRRDPAEAVAAAHHLLLGHGLAIAALRSHGLSDLGVVLNPAPVFVDDSLDGDVVRRIDGTLNRLFLDPVLTGRYPADVLDDLGHWAACIHDGDDALIGQPIDWLGVNYYHDHTYTAAAGVQGAPSPHVTAPGVMSVQVDAPHTDLGWPVTPAGFERLLLRLAADYGAQLPAVYITENGASYDDPLIDGVCHDSRRIAYIDAHLRAMRLAISQGVDVRGYFAWSLLDNFEWAHGFGQRFGLVHVDFDTLVRTPRSSAGWFADVCRNNLLPPLP